MSKSGIYVVQLRSEVLMPVTRDPRYVDVCARVNRSNIKVGKAKNLVGRQLNYWEEFGKENVLFEPLAVMDDIVTAEATILRALKPYRMLSPKNAKLEWLEGISYEETKRLVFAVLDEGGFKYSPIAT